MVANTWIAAAPGDWSDDANWSLGHSPIAGEDPTFDGTSVNNCNADDPTPTGVLTIAAGYSGTITQASDMYISGYSQAGGTFTAIYSKTVTCGSFIKTSGTLTSGVLNLIMNGTGIEYSVNTGIPGKVTIYGSVELKGATGTYAFENNGVANITGSGHGWIVRFFSVGGGPTISPNNNYFINNGEIKGTGYLTFWLYHASVSNLILSNTTCPVQVRCTDPRTLSLGNSWDIGGLLITVEGSCLSTTLNLNGHSLTATTITVGTRGILSNGAATPSVIKCTSLDSSAGTFTPDRTVLVMEGASTLKLAAGGAVENLLSKGVTTLASDVTVSDVCAHVNPITKGAFALTLTKPENEYTGLRRPIIVPVKKSEFGPAGIADGWLRDLGAVI